MSVSITCPTCGVEFDVRDGFYNLRNEDGKTFYCPNGHTLNYRNSTAKQLESAKRTAEARLNEIALLNKQIKRLKRQNQRK